MRSFLSLGMLACLLSACAAGIGVSPSSHLNRGGFNYPAEQIPQVLRTVDPEILYVTDREREGAGYGSERSHSMAFGAAQVSFGENLTWEQLLTRTRNATDRRKGSLTVSGAKEIVRFDSTPLPFVRSGGTFDTRDEARARYRAQTQALQDQVRAQIKKTGNRRLLVFIHGFNNSFEDAVTTLADVWHFVGRQSVPIAYSWPAGNGFGPLGYFRDRDSGEFTIYHTKEFLRMLANMPEVEQIDIIAHSRGTAVATTALRELIIEARAAGKHPKRALKTGVLLLAAPDLDLGIMRQRLQAERFSEAFEQINLYINTQDKALRLSAILTRSVRLGAIKNDDFAPGELDQLRNQALVHFIRVEGAQNGLGHSYFRSNPAVLSDVALALRTRTFPGGTLRPLDQDGPDGVWVLRDDYLLRETSDLGASSPDEG